MKRMSFDEFLVAEGAAPQPKLSAIPSVNDATFVLTEALLNEITPFPHEQKFILSQYHRFQLLSTLPQLPEAILEWGEDDSKYISAVEFVLELKRRLFEAKTSLEHFYSCYCTSSSSSSSSINGTADDKLANTNWLIKRLTEIIAKLESDMKCKLEQSEQEGKYLPRIIKLCKTCYSMTENEQKALLVILILNIGTVFPPIPSLPSISEQRGISYMISKYAGLSSKELIEFFRPSRTHNTQGLFEMDAEGAALGPFGAKFLQMEPTTMRYLLGCELNSEEKLKVETILGNDIFETGEKKLNSCVITTKKAEEENDSDVVLENLMKEVELEEEENVSTSRFLTDITVTSTPVESNDLKQYTKDLEYLEDQFKVLELRIKIRKLELDDGEMISLRQDQRKPEIIIRELKAKEKVAKARLENRLAKTYENGDWLPRLERLIELRKLATFEKNVLLAIIGGMISDEVRSASGKQDEGILGKSFDVGSLLSILCSNLEDRILSRVYFYKSATLIKENIIQLHEPSLLRRNNGGDLLDCSVDIDRKLFDYIVGLDTQIGDVVEGSELFTSRQDLKNVVLSEEKKRLILSTISNYDKFTKVCKEIGFDSVTEYGHSVCILFYGPPGTGKTMTAHGIANYLGKKILQVSVPTLGDATFSREVLRFVFREAKIQNALVFFDECESLFENRANGSKKADTGALLSEIEKSDCLIILATNRPADLDEAMHRRITLDIEFPIPDFVLRQQIWKKHIPERLKVNDTIDWESLALQFEFTGGLIKNAVLSSISIALSRNEETLCIKQQDLEEGARLQLRGHLSIIGEKMHSSSGERRIIRPMQSLSSLIVTESLHAKLVQISKFEKAKKVLRGQWGFDQKQSQNQDTTVILLHGIDGTGKKMATSALGYELGRQILEISCSELASLRFGGPKTIETIFQDAKSLNAIICFVDIEALFSVNSGYSNRGATQADVSFLLHCVCSYGGLALFISSQKSIDTIDSSLLKVAKFIIEFEKPNLELRQKLWNQLLPQKTPKSKDIDLNELAKTFDEFTGGNIWSCIIRASEVAALRNLGQGEQSGGCISQSDLIAACIEEQKMQNLGRISHTSSMFQ